MPFISSPLLPFVAGSALAAAFPAPLGQPIEAGRVTGQDGEIIEIEEDRTDRMTVPVSIEGKGPFDFVIDTGAERTVVSRKIAERLGLEDEEPAELMSMAGLSMVDMVYVPSLQMGSKEYGGLVSPVLAARHIGADGILGLDGLQDQRILFDFADSQITVEDSNHQRSGISPREIVVTARRRSGQLIFTDATIAGIKVNVIVDTGAQVSIANPKLQKRLNRLRDREGEESSLIAVTGDTLGVEFGRARNFKIGRAQFDNLLVAFADAPPFAQFGMRDKPALLLGMDILRKFDRVAIDFVQRKIYFLPPKNARRVLERPLNSRIQS